MKKIFLLSACILFGLTIHAQQGKISDAKAIEQQVDAMVNSWNKHDFSDVKDYTTPDYDWVNIVGMWWKNRKEVQYSTQFYHKIMFNTTPMSKIKVDTRFITPTTAVVHFRSRVGKFVTPDGHEMPQNDELALLVFVKQKGKWLLTAGENVIIDPQAQKNDPVLHMPK